MLNQFLAHLSTSVLGGCVGSQGKWDDGVKSWVWVCVCVCGMLNVATEEFGDGADKWYQ